MSRYFVYRAPDREWWVSERTHNGWWEPVKGFDTWREAFEEAHSRAKDDRARYRWSPVTALTR